MCGDVHRANQPLLEIYDLPAAVGKTFDGPLGSTLTVVELKADGMVIRCTSLSPWQVRQSGAAGREVRTEPGAVRAEGNLNRESATVKVHMAAAAPTPVKLVVLGTKVVAVRVPFKLEHVELK